MKRTLLFFLLVASIPLFSQQNNFSLEFDGLNDFVEFEEDSSTNFTPTDSFSILLWVKIANNNNCQAIAVKGLGGFWDYGIWKGCWIDGPSGNYGPTNAAMFGFHGNHHTFSNDSLSSTNWNFLAGTYNTGTWKLYLNGALHRSYGSSPFISYGGPLTLGRKGTVYQNLFDGKIDELSLWKDDLDSNQIRDVMLCPPSGNEDDLVGYWNFEEGGGTTTEDKSPNDNPGILNFGVNWSSDTPAYSCFSFTEELGQLHVIIQPNPSWGISTLRLPYSMKGKVVFTNLLGDEVTKQDLDGSECQLNLFSLPAKGAYIVQILSQEGQILAVDKLIYH